MYAIAAGAAGVGVLALAQPVEAKIVYTSAKVHIGIGQHYDLDLNHDRVTDFTINDNIAFQRVNLLDVKPAAGNGVVVKNRTVAAALYRGARIGPVQTFATYFAVMATERKGYDCGGNWCNVTNRYLGLKFITNGKTRYGWARLSTYGGVVVTATLTGYAYETTPGKSIIAGKTHGPEDDPTSEDFGPGASVTAPIPNPPQPASLGILALGAQGVSLWRRKESALEGRLKGALL